MSLLTLPKTTKWPFLVGDVLLVALAWFLYWQAKLPLNTPTMLIGVGCIVLGAALAVMPFILDYRAAVRLVESDSLTDTVAQIEKVENAAASISGATSQWQSVHEHAAEAVTAARKVSEQMSGEMKSFMEFFEKANDSERRHLQLEVDKLKRGESEWLQVLVRVLDHVYAIHTAAVRSGQARVIDQLTHFQNACRDAARRVGLAPVEAAAGTAFDPGQHVLPEEKPAPPDARVNATIATGYSFRGQLIRPAMVSLESEPADAPPQPDAGSEPELAL